MKLIIAAVMVFGILCCVGCNSKPAVADDEIAQLKMGMSVAQVNEIIGEEGEAVPLPTAPEGMELPPEAKSATIYAWKNKDGSGVQCTFRNDKLAGITKLSRPGEDR